MYQETRRKDIIAVLRISGNSRQAILGVLDRLELIYELGNPSRFIFNREANGYHVFVDLQGETSQ